MDRGMQNWSVFTIALISTQDVCLFSFLVHFACRTSQSWFLVSSVDSASAGRGPGKHSGHARPIHEKEVGVFVGNSPEFARAPLQEIQEKINEEENP